MFKFEIREAIAAEKPMVLMSVANMGFFRYSYGLFACSHETDTRHNCFDFADAYASAPPDLSALLDDNESLPFRRRGISRLYAHRLQRPNDVARYCIGEPPSDS